MLRPIPPIFLQCEHCEGAGQRNADPCTVCKGRGGYYANVFTGAPVYRRPTQTLFKVSESRFAAAMSSMIVLFIILCFLALFYIT